MKDLSDKQRRMCERCCFLSPECFPRGKLIDCMGDKHRSSFIRGNGFAPLPKRERFKEMNEDI